MNKKAKKLWIDTLRSETLKQGKQRLCVLEDNEYKFCCLGVLCEIYNHEQKLNHKKQLKISQCEDCSDESILFEYDGEVAGLPLKVMDWAGLNSMLPYAGDYSLSGMNDRGESFNKIADVIEKYL